jgi:hypothetical protein
MRLGQTAIELERTRDRRLGKWYSDQWRHRLRPPTPHVGLRQCRVSGSEGGVQPDCMIQVCYGASGAAGPEPFQLVAAREVCVVGAEAEARPGSFAD